MIIENNLLSICNILFKERWKWKYVTNKQKETYFFIINRYLSKQYPDKSNFLNKKNTNKIVSMDIWYHFLEGKPYPSNFWDKKKDKKKKVNDDFKLEKEDINYLIKKFEISETDIKYLIYRYPLKIEEEIKLKSI